MNASLSQKSKEQNTVYVYNIYPFIKKEKERNTAMLSCLWEDLTVVDSGRVNGWLGARIAGRLVSRPSGYLLIFLVGMCITDLMN